MRFNYRAPGGDEVQGTLRAGSFNLAIDGGQTVVTFDDEGRPWTVWRRDRTLRRGYSGRVMEVWKGEDGVRRYRDVDGDEWRAEWNALRDRLAGDLEAIAGRPDVGDLPTRLRRALAVDSDRLAQDARRYRALYGAVGILPPDAYLSVVLQPVIGCPYNRCTFCDFYREVPFEVRDVATFRRHVEAVLDYLGRALPMRRGVFLADADALAVPDDQLLGYLDVIAEALPDQAVSAFTTPFLGHKRPAEVYREARERHLRRVHLGVESGAPDVLRLLGKPPRTDLTRATIERLKEGGLCVGVILMVGAGGHRFAETHLGRSVELVRSLPLDRHDVVYLSPMVVEGRSRYLEQAEAAESRALDRGEIGAQMSAFREAIRRPGGPKVARYDIRDFLD
jgi:radical SAM superfamily enzyme YgiQ (UPF0313 family)